MLISDREFSSWSHVPMCYMRVSMDTLVPLLEGVEPATNQKMEMKVYSSPTNHL